MAQANDLNCFANPEVYDPLSDHCAACNEQKACEQEIETRAFEAQEMRNQRVTDNPNFKFRAVPPMQPVKPVSLFSHPVTTPNPVKYTSQAMQPVEPTTPNKTRYVYPPAQQPQVPATTGCPGIAPISPSPRQQGELLWARLVKNMGLGGLSRMLVEAAQVAEDERMRPVGLWGREEE